MKSAHTLKNEDMGATLEGGSILSGSFPSRKDTVTADVLRRLLSGERLEGVDAVYSSSTTRLAAVINYLTEKYGWFVCRQDKALGCKDGRVATVSVYYLLHSTIAESNKKGAMDWCAEVRAARTNLRAKAAEAKRKADAINAARMKHLDERQADLFGGAAP